MWSSILPTLDCSGLSPNAQNCSSLHCILCALDLAISLLRLLAISLTVLLSALPTARYLLHNQTFPSPSTIRYQPFHRSQYASPQPIHNPTTLPSPSSAPSTALLESKICPSTDLPCTSITRFLLSLFQMLVYYSSLLFEASRAWIML